MSPNNKKKLNLIRKSWIS